MHSSVKIARYSIYFFWLGLFLNIIILIMISYRLFFSPLVPSTPGTSTPGTSTPGTSTPGTSTSGTSTPGTSTPGTLSNIDNQLSFSVTTNKLNYTCSFIGSNFKRPFMNDGSRMLTIGDYWENGRILTITPYRIISLIGSSEFIITQYEKTIRFDTEQSDVSNKSIDVPSLFK